MPTYKLTYFDVRALGEPIRMLLTYMGQEFEDVRLTFDEWMKIKSTSPFGKLPTLEVDGKTITQSAAICRYLGREAGLAGESPWEDLQIDIIVDTFTDFRKDVSGFHHEPDPEVKEKKRLALLKETVPFYFERFDKIIKENNGYVANGKLSWADIFLFGFSDTLIAQLQDDVFSSFPNIKEWRESIANIPSIKEWIAKRPNTKL
uniref:glutathione transferase n=1 Tax=Lygus hesperus TaxID=30085 RepID=A0A146LSX5_LYGHE